MNDAQFETFTAIRDRIFGAQRDLINKCGGYKRAMDLTGRSKSEVGRWFGGADQDFMPLIHVSILERDCGYALVTSVMADLTGRSLSDPETERKMQLNIMTAHAEAMRQAAEVSTEFAMSILDGEISPSEAVRIDRKLAAQQRAIEDQRAALAVIKARGGGAAVLRTGEDGQ